MVFKCKWSQYITFVKGTESQDLLLVLSTWAKTKKFTKPFLPVRMGLR